jgi:hypothetical protein
VFLYHEWGKPNDKAFCKEKTPTLTSNFVKEKRYEYIGRKCLIHLLGFNDILTTSVMQCRFETDKGLGGQDLFYNRTNNETFPCTEQDELRVFKI